MKNFCVLFFLFIGITYVVSQGCVPYEFEAATKDCEAFSKDRLIFTYPQLGQTLESQTAFFDTVVPALNISARLPVRLMPWKCAKSYLKLMCPTFYPTCNQNFATVPSPVVKPCTTLCDQMNFDCQEFWAGLGLPGLPCNLPSPIDGQPLWQDPAEGVCFNYTNNDDFLPPGTVTNAAEDKFGDAEWACPKPLSFNGKFGDPLPCQLTCLQQAALVVEGNDWDDGWDVFVIMWWFSAVFAGIVLIGYLVYPDMRVWPRRIVLFLCIGMILSAINPLGASFQSKEDAYCDDEFNTSHHGWCRFAGFIFFYGALVTTFWWFIQAVVLFWNVGLLKDPEVPKKLEPLMHIFAWGVPLIFASIMLGLDHLGARTAQPYCFTYEASNGLEWGLFFWVLTVGIILIPIMLVVVMVRIYNEASAEQSKWERSRYQIQLGIFAFCFFFSVLAILVLRFWVLDNEDDLQEGAENYYACIYGASNTQDECEDEIKYVDRGLWWWNLTFIAFQGTYVFAIFGLLNYHLRDNCCRSAKSFTHATTSFVASSASRSEL